MSTLDIRPAAETEQTIVKDLLNDGKNRKVAYGDMSWGKMIDWCMPEIQQHFAESTVYLVRTAGTRLPIATFALQSTDMPTWGEESINDTARYIHRLSVRDDHKGKGIGGQILDWVMVEAQQSGTEYLRLDCNAASGGLIAVYEDYGFERVSVGNLLEYQNCTTQLMQKSTVVNITNGPK